MVTLIGTPNSFGSLGSLGSPCPSLGIENPLREYIRVGSKDYQHYQHYQSLVSK